MFWNLIQNTWFGTRASPPSSLHALKAILFLRRNLANSKSLMGNWVTPVENATGNKWLRLIFMVRPEYWLSLIPGVSPFGFALPLMKEADEGSYRNYNIAYIATHSRDVYFYCSWEVKMNFDMICIVKSENVMYPVYICPDFGTFGHIATFYLHHYIITCRTIALYIMQLYE